MNFAQLIEKDYIAAYKAKDKVRLATLRHVKTAATNLQKDVLRELTDDDYIDVLLKQAKQRKDSIEQYAAAGREDLAANESAELAVLEQYLPKQLSPEELTAMVVQECAAWLDGGKANMGKAIAAILSKYKGQVNGKAVSEAVKALFQSS